MTIERQLEFLILKIILEDYDKGLIDRESLDENYNTSKMENRYIELEKEFLNDYALNKTEKSD